MTPFLQVGANEVRGEFEALVAGHWSIVQTRESDARRYMLAVRNSPDEIGAAALSPTQARALLLRGQGATYKLIAFELGLPTGPLFRLVKGGMSKLGVTRDTDLPLFFPTRTAAEISTGAKGRTAVRDATPTMHPMAPPDFRAARIDDDGREFLLMSYAVPDWELPRILTGSERDVVRILLAGSTHDEIAKARRTSPRTIANQIATAFSKLGVKSRMELARMLERPMTASSAYHPSSQLRRERGKLCRYECDRLVLCPQSQPAHRRDTAHDRRRGDARGI